MSCYWSEAIEKKKKKKFSTNLVHLKMKLIWLMILRSGYLLELNSCPMTNFIRIKLGNLFFLFPLKLEKIFWVLISIHRLYKFIHKYYTYV